MKIQIPLRATAWVEAAWVFAMSRFVILLVTIIAVANIPLAHQTSPRQCAFDSSCLLTWWLHWDVIDYITIADHSYSSLRDTAFFPLWPLLLHGAHTFKSYYVSGLLLSNIFFYLALVLLYHLVAEIFEPSIARKALLYLAFAAYGIYFFVGYTESLFLMLSLALFYCLQHERYWLAGFCGLLASLTHSQGLLLVIPFMTLIIQRFWLSKRSEITWQEKIRASIPLILIPLGLAIYMLYLAYTKGDPIAFSTQEELSWHRHMAFPLVSLILTVQTFFIHPSLHYYVLNTLDMASVLIFLVILILGWKHLPLHYSLFALTLIIFALSYPQGLREPLNSTPRFMLIIFPIFVILAKWGKHPRIDQLILACSLPLFTLNAAFFASHYWVA
jgi:Gpi18-like mannosyltransferase